jgi:hypothetical protein
MFAFVSCDKDKNDTKPAPEPPTITKIDVSSETVAGVARPKFTITLNVPDESSVLLLQIFQNAQFPNTESGKIANPKSGVYTVIDMTATYPPTAPVKYFAFFTMKGYSYKGHYDFDVK